VLDLMLLVLVVVLVLALALLVSFLLEVYRVMCLVVVSEEENLMLVWDLLA
jgi:hypothetical protein